MHWQTLMQGFWKEVIWKHQKYWTSAIEFLRTTLIITSTHYFCRQKYNSTPTLCIKMLPFSDFAKLI